MFHRRNGSTHHRGRTRRSGTTSCSFINGIFVSSLILAAIWMGFLVKHMYYGPTGATTGFHLRENEHGGAGFNSLFSRKREKDDGATRLQEFIRLREEEEERQQEKDRQRQRLKRNKSRNGVLNIGFCRNDNLDYFAHQVGEEIAYLRGMNVKFTDLNLDGDELETDIVMCERGTTKIIERKLAALKPDYSLEKWTTGQVTENNFGRRKPFLSYIPEKIYVVKSSSNTGQIKFHKPLVIRYHMEPWHTAIAKGVDIAIDCKTSKKTHPQHVPIMYGPYLYLSFGHKQMSAAKLTKSIVSKVPKEDRGFVGFLVSYCSSRVKSAAFRTFFFNALTEYFSVFMGTRSRSRSRGASSLMPPKVPQALGNCQPRVFRGKEPWFRLQAGELLSTDKVQAAVNAFSKFRFGIAFENSQVEGYLTEKIANVKLSGAIPIYWGDPKVDEKLNTKAFVWCNVSTASIKWDESFNHAALELGESSLSSSAVLDKVEDQVMEQLGGKLQVFRHCIEQVVYLETHPDAYEKMMREPLVAGGIHGSILDPFSYAEQIEGIVKSLES